MSRPPERSWILATLIGSSAEAFEENMPAAAEAAVLCRNFLRLIFIAAAIHAVADRSSHHVQIARHTGFCRFLIQLPVSTGFHCRSQPYQRRFFEVSSDQHQADRQTIDAATWHGEGRMPGNVECAGVGL